ncbi:MAG TPA: flavin reductase [Bosea sp. (in: a-proteobacteria)]|jgi:flavin reductase (DIM6/NTAB) family NADH-FMN oxidoreductase RutF/DNA-binding MarR family transcriptional regulator|nr:flavin reductase [Bosea sp. (in: a-proteobacteria)]
MKTAVLTEEYRDTQLNDPRAFRKCLGQFATGVTVVTAEVGGERFGVTANSFSSLSIDPPLIMWAIGRNSRSFEAFKAARHFAVHILSAGQIATSQCFSSSRTDKFSGIPNAPGKTGAPTLEGALGLIECRTENIIEAGDHVLIIGHVVHFVQGEGEPLVFSQGRYGLAVDHPELKVDGPGAPENSGVADPSEAALFFRLMFGAFHALFDSFDAHRRAEDITPVELRALVGIYEVPDSGMQDLLRRMHLTPAEAQDAVADLLERGDICQSLDGKMRVTQQGRLRRRAVAARESQFEGEQLDGLPTHEIAATRKLLNRLIRRNASTP